MRIPFPHAWLLFSFYFALLRAILYWFDHFFYMRSRAYSLFVSLTTFSFSFYDLASYFFYALVRYFFLCALALIYITPAPVSFIPRAHFFIFLCAPIPFLARLHFFYRAIIYFSLATYFFSVELPRKLFPHVCHSLDHYLSSFCDFRSRPSAHSFRAFA